MVLKAKILQAKYEAKLEFLGGGGCAKQKPSVGVVWIFSKTTQYPLVAPGLSVVLGKCFRL